MNYVTLHAMLNGYVSGQAGNWPSLLCSSGTRHPLHALPVSVTVCVGDAQRHIHAHSICEWSSMQSSVSCDVHTPLAQITHYKPADS